LAVAQRARQCPPRPRFPRRAGSRGGAAGALVHRQGRSRGIRGPLPASALRRHEEAHRHRPELDRRSADPADGRAVRRARRADAAEHGERAARSVAGEPQDRAVHHPRPRGGDRARRPRRRADRRTGAHQGRLRGRPAAAARRRRDPPQPRFHRALSPDLGRPARRGEALLRGGWAMTSARHDEAPALTLASGAAPPRRLLVLALRLGVLVVLVGIWQVLADTGAIDPFFFSRPSAIAAQIWRWLVGGYIWPHLLVTLVEALLAFVIGTVLGIAAGLAFARIELLAAVFDPYIRIFNALPRVILAPIFILWFGLGIASKVALGVTLVFFVVFFNTFQGIREV